MIFWFLNYLNFWVKVQIGSSEKKLFEDNLDITTSYVIISYLLFLIVANITFLQKSSYFSKFQVLIK